MPKPKRKSSGPVPAGFGRPQARPAAQRPAAKQPEVLPAASFAALERRETYTLTVPLRGAVGVQVGIGSDVYLLDEFCGSLRLRAAGASRDLLIRRLGNALSAREVKKGEAL